MKNLRAFSVSAINLFSAICFLLLATAWCGCVSTPLMVEHRVSVTLEERQISLFDYRGAIHIHSTYSDGGGDISLIARAARQAGLDFAVVTDHGTLQGLSEEGWRDSVLVLVGAELSTTGGHLLALGCRELPEQNESQLAINAVEAQGGLSFLAHPFRAKRPWDEWHVKRFTGMEVYSLSGDYFDEPLTSKMRSLFLTMFSTDFALRVLQDNPQEAIRKWDELLRTQNVVGIAGVDVHSKLKLTRWFHLRLPKYRALLGAVNTHVLTDNPLTGSLLEDKQAVYGALASGHCYIAFDNLHPATGFSLVVFDADGTPLIMGDEVSFRSDIVFHVSAPAPDAKVRMLRDGELFMEGTASISGRIAEAGVYRAEAYLGERLWILSNPIYVREG